ncbi:MAG: Tellurite resistance protein TerB [Phormidium sp. SL48-SHIP]|nr:MAG: Tellurite resistance protein TerB [Phormidium sp. SL48-SHIP]
MGLFDRVLGAQRRTEVTLGPAEAFIGITLLAIAADGYIAKEEMQVLVTTLCRLKMFRSYSSDVIASTIDRLMGVIQRQGPEALLSAAVATLPHDLYETTFAITTDIILADGEVSPEEEVLLNELHQLLNIPDELAVQIINVMIIKNRG